MKSDGRDRFPCEVLIIDDDEIILDLMADFLNSSGFQVESATTAEEALKKVKVKAYDAIITDLNLPGLKGTEVVKRALDLYPETIIFVITGEASIQSAVQCMKLGACDFIPKPFEMQHLVSLLQDALDKRAEAADPKLSTAVSSQALKQAQSVMIGTSEAMREVFELIEVVARSNSTILITGETGTGKELVARAIHQLSPRSEGRLVSLNCAAVPENLLEDELFGHVKGAFTGAQTNRAGRFEQAHKGTLFLDEIGYMSPNLQVKLLRVLQEREFERLGSSQTIKCDVRLIAATSANLERMINEGTFRRDLYYRLNVIPINLPPLRQRRDDIPLLVQHFIKKFCQQLGVNTKQISQQTMKRLMSYDWPGNVRELENVIERATVLSRKREQILPGDLPAEVQGAEVPSILQNFHIPDEGICFDTIVSNIERELILQTLQKTGGNKSLAADLLKMKRTTLIEKLKRLNVNLDNIAQAPV